MQCPVLTQDKERAKVYASFKAAYAAAQQINQVQPFTAAPTNPPWGYIVVVVDAPGGVRLGWVAG